MPLEGVGESHVVAVTDTRNFRNNFFALSSDCGKPAFVCEPPLHSLSL